MSESLTPRPTRTLRAGLIAVALMLLCGLAAPASATPRLRAAGTDGGWSISDPAAEGMDAATLDQARAYAFVPSRNTQGVVVTRSGKIVDEWYAPGEGPRSWSASWSMAKSVTSILIGIAIDQGKIASVDEPMTTWFPDWIGTPKAAVTLKNVLQMASGIQSSEDYDPAHLATSDVIRMGASADELAYSRARPLATTPGTVWNYSSADTMLLSHVLEVATGMPADQFAQQVLFGPLGITQVEWWRDAANHTLTYCCLDMTTRDFARIGLLYLHNGNWDGSQVVSASWVHDSLQGTAESGGLYGYQWWITSAPGVTGPVYMMNGFDGQFVFIIPSLDMVVARNGYYVKSECEPIADPNLFGKYPPTGLNPNAGTHPPSDWNHSAFLTPIVTSVTGAATTDVVPAPEPAPGTRDPDGQAMAPCPASQTTTSTTTLPTTATPASPAALPVAAQPTYTG